MKKNKSGNNIFQAIVHPIFLVLYKLTVGPIICKLMFNVKATGINLRKQKGSYLLIGNHVNNFDGLYFQYYARSVVRFVMNERLFRMGALAPLLRWFHYIPKKKFSKDLKTVRLMFAAKQQGKIVGVFPEGRRNWDGRTQNHIGSIASLAKSLKIPVIAGINKGGYSSQPRWSGERRRGKIEIEFKEIITLDDIKTHSNEELLEIVTRELDLSVFKRKSNLF